MFRLNRKAKGGLKRHLTLKREEESSMVGIKSAPTGIKEAMDALEKSLSKLSKPVPDIKLVKNGIEFPDGSTQVTAFDKKLMEELKTEVAEIKKVLAKLQITDSGAISLWED